MRFYDFQYLYTWMNVCKKFSLNRTNIVLAIQNFREYWGANPIGDLLKIIWIRKNYSEYVSHYLMPQIAKKDTVYI